MTKRNTNIITAFILFLALAGTLAHDIFPHHHHDEEEHSHTIPGIVYGHSENHSHNSHTGMFFHSHMTGISHKPYYNNHILQLLIFVLLVSLVIPDISGLLERKQPIRKDKPDRVLFTYRPVLSLRAPPLEYFTSTC